VNWAVEIEDMTVAYDRHPVLWDVDMKVPQGALAAVLGPNGAGKSTLLKAALGLIPTISGRVKFYVNGTLSVFKEDKKQIVYVPQSGSVDWDFPTTVLDVVLMGRYGHLGWFRRPGKQDRELALRTLEKIGMADYENRQIKQLSGGQQQRTLLARALCAADKMILLDEPAAGLDPEAMQYMYDLIAKLNKEGMTIVMITHDVPAVVQYANRIVRFVDGTVKEVSTDEYRKVVEKC